MSDQRPAKENTCAVIVTHQPDREFLARAQKIAALVDALIIVDNHSADTVVTMLRDVAVRFRSELILNDNNLGLAAGLNQGMRRAHQRGYVWCLAFDQDSEPMGRMLETLASIHDQTEYRASLGVIGANFIEVGRQQPGVRVAPAAGRSWVERPAVITAGSLYSVAAVGQVGSFREEFFLDHVDSDYCLRLRAHGYRVIMACEPLMTHALGRQTWHRFFGKRVGCSNHSPLRRYYNTRNRLVLAREYLRREPAWVLTNLRGLSRETLLILLFESEKAAKLRAMARGAWHAVTGRFENPLTS